MRAARTLAPTAHVCLKGRAVLVFPVKRAGLGRDTVTRTLDLGHLTRRDFGPYTPCTPVLAGVGVVSAAQKSTRTAGRKTATKDCLGLLSRRASVLRSFRTSADEPGFFGPTETKKLPLRSGLRPALEKGSGQSFHCDLRRAAEARASGPHFGVSSLGRSSCPARAATCACPLFWGAIWRPILSLRSAGVM
jgi:hypothetical protein